MFKKLLAAILLFTAAAKAQVIVGRTNNDNDLKLTTLPYYNFGKGVGITSPDSLFQFNIRFRIQNRITYIDNEGQPPAYAGEIRRLRLRFDGFVGNPKFLYAIQLSFAPGDTGEIKEGENLNIIRDAVIYYRPNASWNISFGQTKLPGNRQRVNSSGGLQLTDRTINNARFTIDRDFGIQIHQLNEFKNKFSYNFKTAISTGEGRNVTGNADDGLALTGKAEIFPFGAFTKDGTYFEGDLMREKTPKLMFSGVFQQNNHARRTGGQLGEELYHPLTMKSVFFDTMLKYQGWAAMAAYMSRSTTTNPITYNPEDPTQMRYAFTGHGYDFQGSYLFKSNYEIIGRYSIQKANDEISMIAPDAQQFSLGLTKYIWEHTFKLQGELTFDKLQYFDGSEKNNWYLRFQVEMGI
ncbi:porin [Flavobacterium silvaticum]|uniref:Porin n=1 Tax=Flavobacterium silvaticum TaxID=1852020 RepID=A0A972FS09_9FLAO|nr:porin [Flavobacterium silvaticum]NMH26947.1 porin [Flavobacterium silvaticum]